MIPRVESFASLSLPYLVESFCFFVKCTGCRWLGVGCGALLRRVTEWGKHAAVTALQSLDVIYYLIRLASTLSSAFHRGLDLGSRTVYYTTVHTRILREVVPRAQFLAAHILA